jgi:signal recognition particle GTPase
MFSRSRLTECTSRSSRVSHGPRRREAHRSSLGCELTEESVDQALRDVRLSLLEADVELNVKRFLARVKEKMLGQVVRLRAERRARRPR